MDFRQWRNDSWRSPPDKSRHARFLRRRRDSCRPTSGPSWTALAIVPATGKAAQLRAGPDNPPQRPRGGRRTPTSWSSASSVNPPHHLRPRRPRCNTPRPSRGRTMEQPSWLPPSNRPPAEWECPANGVTDHPFPLLEGPGAGRQSTPRRGVNREQQAANAVPAGPRCFGGFQRWRRASPARLVQSAISRVDGGGCWPTADFCSALVSLAQRLMRHGTSARRSTAPAALGGRTRTARTGDSSLAPWLASDGPRPDWKHVDRSACAGGAARRQLGDPLPSENAVDLVPLTTSSAPWLACLPGA